MRALLLAFICYAATVAAQVDIKLPCEFASQDISPTGKHVAVLCKDGSVHLLEVPGGREVTALAPSDDFFRFDFSKDGKWFAAGNRKGEMEVVSIASPTDRKRWHANKGGFVALEFVSDNTVAVALRDAPGQVWDVSASPTQRATLDVDFSGLTSIAASGDGKWVVTTGADTVVRFYETSTWNMVGEYRGYMLEPFASAFTSDSKYALVAGADGQLTLFDASSAKPVRTLPTHTDPIQELHVIDNNRLAILSVDADGHKLPRLEVWDIAKGNTKVVETDKEVTGGGVVDGRIWLARGSGNNLAFSVGQ